MELLNFRILKSPLSWLTIVMMVLIVAIAAHIVFDSFGINPARAIDPTQNPPEGTPDLSTGPTQENFQ